MEIQKDCDNCEYSNRFISEMPCKNCDTYYDKWEPRETEYKLINPNELITELNTKLYSEKELNHMSNRDAITGEAVNKVVGELIEWVKNK